MRPGEYWKRIEPGDIDYGVLDRVIEAEVQMWLAAKMARLREQGIPTHCLSGNMMYREDEPHHFDFSWTIHAVDKLAMNHPTLDPAVAELRAELLDNPGARALEKRRIAREALAEAETLEALAATGPAAEVV